MLTVGAFSRASGLPVSALRYYDAAGLLLPAHVDPASGYRWYTLDQIERARLVAGLRRTGMPVADICRAITADPVTARRIVDAHQRRLETEFATATEHLDKARQCLSMSTSLIMDATALRAGLGAVRHAVGEHPAWQALHGVLFDVGGNTLRLVANDRHRLAITTMPTLGVTSPPMKVIVPTAVVDAFLGGTEATQVSVSLSARHIALGGADGSPVEAIYPDYEALVARHRPPANGKRGHLSGPAWVTMNAPDLLAEITHDEGGMEQRDRLIHIGLDPSGIRIGSAPGTAAFSKQYLTEAVRSFGNADLQLNLGERGPLSLTAVGVPEAFALLMPVRLKGQAA